MFNQYQKNEWIERIQYGHERFIKKGKESNYLIGRLCRIDWDIKLDKLTNGVESINTLLYDDALWVKENDVFIVTDIVNGGIGTTVVLDHRFTVSPFRVYDTLFLQYLYNFADINGHGYFYTDIKDSDIQNPNISTIMGYEYIVHNKKVCGGRPTIIGTRIEPWHIAEYGSMEAILADWNYLTEHQVNEALQYYRANLRSQLAIKENEFK